MRMRLVLSRAMSDDQSDDSNCTPRSVVNRAGTPKQETQVVTNWQATVSAVASEIGTASGQRVKRSTIVRRWRDSVTRSGWRADNVNVDMSESGVWLLGGTSGDATTRNKPQ